MLFDIEYMMKRNYMFKIENFSPSYRELHDICNERITKTTPKNVDINNHYDQTLKEKNTTGTDRNHSPITLAQLI